MLKGPTWFRLVVMLGGFVWVRLVVMLGGSVWVRLVVMLVGSVWVRLVVMLEDIQLSVELLLLVVLLPLTPSIMHAIPRIAT